MYHHFGKHSVGTIAEPIDVFLFLCYWYTDSFSRTTLAEPGRLGLRLNFPEPYVVSNLKISFSTAKTLQNSEIYNEIDTATLKCQVKIHTSAFGSLTAAMEEDTNQTSRQSRKWRIFHIWKLFLGEQSTLGDTGSLNVFSLTFCINCFFFCISRRMQCTMKLVSHTI